MIGSGLPDRAHGKNRASAAIPHPGPFQSANDAIPRIASRADVVVVGAGLGGLASAVRLAKLGYRVTVLEKNSQAGGRCSRIEVDGFKFDTGPTRGGL
jgi:monoamine oxidase